MTKSLAFIGSQTRWKQQAGEGIYSCTFDTQDGSLHPTKVFDDIENPSFLLCSRNKNRLYSVIEIDDFEGKKTGAVAAFAMDTQTGDLTLLNRYATQGSQPCHLRMDSKERVLIASNYGGGSVAVFPLLADGSLGELVQLISYEGSGIHPNQTASHAHSAVFSPDDQYVYVQDLGTDNIRIYELVFNGNSPYLVAKKPAIRLEPGAGPRHFVFHPTLAVAYLMNELNSTVVVFDYQSQTGDLVQKQVLSSLPTDFLGQNSAADIHLTGCGRFLYASNRGHDSLAIFAVHPGTGMLTALGHQATLGMHPRNFAISADDRWLLCANRNTDNIVSFSIDSNTGYLTPSNQDNRYFHKPVCVILDF